MNVGISEITFASIALDIFALIITIFLIVSNLKAQMTHRKRNELFLAMLAVNAIALLCDMITWIIKVPQHTVMMYIVNSLVFILGYVMTVLLTIYLSTFIVDAKPLDRYIIKGIYIGNGIGAALVCVSPINGMYFYVEGDQVITGEYGWISVAFAFAMIMGDMLLVFYHRRDLSMRHTVVFLSYALLPLIGFVIQMMGTDLTVTWLAATLTMLLIYLMIHVESVRKLDMQEIELVEKRLEISQSRTALMISQIQPHFLYNSLTVIDQLIKIDPNLASEALADFSTYLRCNLASLRYRGLIPFSDELRHIKAYLALEEMRFDEYLKVIYDIQTEDFDIPPLSVQPLAENAVKHGLSNKMEGGSVTISTRELPDRYEVTVTDDGVGFAPGDEMGTDGSGEHLGIPNIRTRLTDMCGGTLNIESVKGRGTRATVTIYKGGD